MVSTKSTNTNLQRSLGPIADLESHLPEEWWRTLFNAVYIKTDGDVVENDYNTTAEVDFIESVANLTPDSRIIDLCCGQGRHVIELARRGYKNVTGVDRSRYLIRLARKRARAQSLSATFKEGDARTPRVTANSYDCLTIMGNSFGYFSNRDEDTKVLAAAAKLLKISGSIILDLADGEWLVKNYEKRSWEWIDEHHFVCRERSLATDGDRLISREVVTHDERGVIADQFYAERLYTRDSIATLLRAAGFRNIRHHAKLPTQSDRNQDLGMMAHRMLITADAPIKKVDDKQKPKRKIDLAVLLGDPHLPDIVKLGGQFNQEDHDTVSKLKDALKALPNYQVRYLDNHAKWETDLAASPIDLVFNLCDEGYNNDAFKELHVPALLEMRDLKYTGGGPQCLATCYDKGMVRAVAMQLDIPVPYESYVRPSDQGATLPAIFPAILKPNCGDSSEGITKGAVVHDQGALLNYLEGLREQFPNRSVLIQEFMTGAEYSVGLIGNPDQGLRALPILEVDYSKLPEGLPKILGYESKWDPKSPYWNSISYIESDLEDDKQSRLTDYSMRLFERLGCRDYARFDFRADRDGEIKLLEVNPNPGWCWDGKLNLMAGFEGQTYVDFISSILDAALARIDVSVTNGNQKQI